MRKAALMTAALWITLTACGGQSGENSDRTRRQARAAPTFTAKGTAVTANSEQIAKLASAGADVPGLAGSFVLQPSSLETLSKRCLVEGQGSIVILYTLGTRFEPVEASTNTLGRQLTVSGTVLEKGDSCMPVANRVVDAVFKPGTELPPPLVAGSTGQRGTGTAPASKSGKRTAKVKAGGSRAASPPEPPGLPPLAPKVTSTFRPSLPDPPPFTR